MAVKTSKDNGEEKNSAIYTTPENNPYISPTPGEITRLAVTPNIIGQIPKDEKLYEELRECGFNAAAIFIGKVARDELNQGSSLSKTIGDSKRNNISLFIQSDTISQSESLMEQLVKYFANCTNLSGWWLLTPSNDEIESNGNSCLVYNSILNFEKDASQSSGQNRHMVFMNVYASSEGAGTDDYRQYLIRFQDNIKPSIWGAAVYPAGISSSGAIINNYDLFFRNLQIMSLLSRYCGRPFWAYVMCQSYMSHTGYSTAFPSLEEMRFSTFSSLAYGAQGLEFWSYRLRENEVLNGVTQVSYLNAPVGKDGKKDEKIWNAVQTVNREIKALNEVFFESYLVEVRHTGTKQYDATSMLTEAFGPLISLTSGTSGVLVSHLNTHGRNYLVIVNHTFRSGEEESQVITLKFAPMWTVKQLRAVNGILVKSKITAVSLNIILPRGGYVIYEWS